MFLLLNVFLPFSFHFFFFVLPRTSSATLYAYRITAYLHTFSLNRMRNIKSSAGSLQLSSSIADDLVRTPSTRSTVTRKTLRSANNSISIFFLYFLFGWKTPILRKLCSDRREYHHRATIITSSIFANNLSLNFLNNKYTERKKRKNVLAVDNSFVQILWSKLTLCVCGRARVCMNYWLIGILIDLSFKNIIERTSSRSKDKFVKCNLDTRYRYTRWF